MKKLLTATVSAALLVTMAGCTKTTTAKNTTKPGTVTTASKTTAKGNKTTTAGGNKTTAKNTTTAYTKPELKMPEYESTYQLHDSDTLPVIKITSESGKNDFITTPVSSTVKAQERIGWNGNQYQSAPDPYYENCTINVTDENGGSALTDVSAQVKVRGNWTSTYAKKPLRIKFAEKQEMLDLNGGAKKKNWVLIAEYKDWSMLRDTTALYTSHLLSGYYTTDFRFVEVYVNDVYQGVYLLAEQQEVNKDRVNINKPADGYTGNDIGYFFEYDCYAQYEQGADDYNFKINYTPTSITDALGNAMSNFNRYYTIKSDIYSDSQVSFLKNYTENLFTICYNAIYNNKYTTFNSDFTEVIADTTSTSAFECISRVINVESLVDTYIQNEICCDPDLYLTSFLMDVDFSETGSKKLTFEANWDYDSSLGNKRHCSDAQGLFAGAGQYNVNYETGNGMNYSNPWMVLFAGSDWFQNLVQQKWNMVYEQGIFKKVINMIDAYTTKYSTYFENNDALWAYRDSKDGNRELSGILDELNSSSKAATTQADAAAWLKTWYTNRIAYLNTYFNSDTYGKINK